MDISFDTPQTVTHSFPGSEPVTVEGVVRIMDKAVAEAEGFGFAKGAPSTFGILTFERPGAVFGVAHLPVDVTFCEVHDS